MIAVIGAGIIGMMSAYSLAKRGAKVVAIEREAEPARAASFANGGQWSVANSETWHQWRLLRAIFNTPNLFRVKPTRENLAFFARFLAAFPRHAALSERTAALALESRALYQPLVAELARHGASFDHTKTGILQLFYSAASFNAARQVEQKLNFGRTALTTADIAALDPLLNTDGVAGALYAADDSVGDAYAFCKALRTRLMSAYDVRFEQADIAHIQRDGKRIRLAARSPLSDTAEAAFMDKTFDKVVIAAGYESAALAAPFTRLPLVAVTGYSVTLTAINASNNRTNDAPATPSLPRVAVLDSRQKVATAPLVNAQRSRLRVAGFAHWLGHSARDNAHNGKNPAIDNTYIARLTDWTRHYYPTFQWKDETHWACHRPMLPDMMPRVAAIAKGVYINIGAGHLGWTLGAVLGERLANTVLERQIPYKAC